MNLKTDYDTAWKATLETFLPACLEITHSQLAQVIDWSMPPEFLDTELQEIVRGSETGRKRVDKLIKVHRKVMRLVHWLLALPDEEELEFRKDVRHMEASMQTKRRSTYERIVLEEGLVQGRLEGRSEGRLEGLDQGRHEGRLIAGRELLLEQIHERFGGCGDALRQRVEAIQDESRIRQLARAILTVPTLQEFEARVSG